MDWLTKLAAYTPGLGGTQQVTGGERAQFTPKLQKVDNNPWAQVANPLENGHDGNNQYVNKKVGYCNPICVA